MSLERRKTANPPCLPDFILLRILTKTTTYTILKVESHHLDRAQHALHGTSPGSVPARYLRFSGITSFDFISRLGRHEGDYRGWRSGRERQPTVCDSQIVLA